MTSKQPNSANSLLLRQGGIDDSDGEIETHRSLPPANQRDEANSTENKEKSECEPKHQSHDNADEMSKPPPTAAAAAAAASTPRRTNNKGLPLAPAMEPPADASSSSHAGRDETRQLSLMPALPAPAPDAMSAYDALRPYEESIELPPPLPLTNEQQPGAHWIREISGRGGPGDVDEESLFPSRTSAMEEQNSSSSQDAVQVSAEIVDEALTAVAVPTEPWWSKHKRALALVVLLVAIGAVIGTIFGLYDKETITTTETPVPTMTPLPSWLQLGQDINGTLKGDWFGYSVSTSADGRTVAIGAPWEGGFAGSTRVLHFVGEDWVQLGAEIVGEAALYELGDELGWSVSLSADGNVVAIGAHASDSVTGHVSVYRHVGADWVQLGADIEGEAESNQSGESVSLSADGSTVAVGAPRNGENGYNSGHVRVFQFVGKNWAQLGTDIDGKAESDMTGWSVSLSADKSTVAMGAIQSGGAGDSRPGQVRVFRFFGEDWVQLGADINGKVEGDSAGQSVSLSADGSIVVIGAPFNDDKALNSGHARVYRFDGKQWTRMGQDLHGRARADVAGSSVSLSGDGNRLAIGAPNAGGNTASPGYVQVFELEGERWQQIGLDIEGENVGDLFGGSVALSKDGDAVTVGTGGSVFGSRRLGYVRVYQLVWV